MRPPPLCGLLVRVCLLCLTVLPAADAPAQALLSPQHTAGKMIYHTGSDGSQDDIQAILADGRGVYPATQFACVNCHGSRGEGRQEGGLRAPPIRWEELTRHAYDAATLARAVTAGLRAAGAPLHAAMPRYRMTGVQLASLTAYLSVLGGPMDMDAGLSDTTITVGAVLPSSGPLAALGDDLRATLTAYFAAVNTAGGVYGRRFALVTADAGDGPSAALAAMRHLIDVEAVFTLVASFVPGESRDVHAFIEQRAVPLIGPLTPMTQETAGASHYVYSLVPLFSDQARVLVDYVAAQGATPGLTPAATTAGEPACAARLGVMYADTALGQDAVAGWHQQTRLHQCDVVLEHRYPARHFSAPDAMRLLAATPPDYLFFFGGPADVRSLSTALAQAHLTLPLLTSMAMLGRTAFDLPAPLTVHLRLAYPLGLPPLEDFTELDTLLRHAGHTLRHPAFQSLAFAAAKVLVEATMRSGRSLSRATLLAQLDQLRAFKTGVLPPLTFNSSRKVGALGSYVVRVDVANQRYVPLTGWLTPQ